MKVNDAVYQKSNSIEGVDNVRLTDREYDKVLCCSASANERRMMAQSLIDSLCSWYNIKRCRVMVRDEAQPPFKNGRGKTLGRYTFSSIGRPHIDIWNLTAKQKKVVSIKVFMDTLLHEFMHHYDIEYLKLGATIHCSGFYKRISDLDARLKGVK